jgi:hypothetical protein
MYHGNYETNYGSLKAGASTFKGTDGAERPLPPWPNDVDGVRVGYMEKPGKHFTAVRVIHGDSDIVLKNAVIIDPMQHMEMGKRFSADATIVGDEPMLALLKQAAQSNPDQELELQDIRNKIKRAANLKK